MGNQLTSLDLSNNTKFETLLCHGNQLTAIDVSRLTSLKTFRCGYNQLTALDISQNINLETLRCSGNHISDISSFVANPGLSGDDTVDIRHNDLDCDDWDNITILRNRLGPANVDGGGWLQSGFGFSPQNNLDPFECSIVSEWALY